MDTESCEIISMKGSVTRRIGCESWSKLSGDVYRFGGQRNIVMKSCVAKSGSYQYATLIYAGNGSPYPDL